jgi:hypothetical protein
LHVGGSHLQREDVAEGIYQDVSLSSCNFLTRIAADSKGEHALVRMAAIANLARFGSASDRDFLDSLEKRDTRIAHAVRRALVAIP